MVSETLSAEATRREAAGEAARSTRVVSMVAAGETTEATGSRGEWQGISSCGEGEVGAGGCGGLLLVLGGDHGEEDGSDKGADLDHLD